jgi:NTE family protein
VNIRSGNFVYFDNATDQIGPQHVMASGSLPSGFPATEIEGEFFWDGGLVSNTPLQWVLDYSPRQDTLVFQLDLWSAAAEGHPLLQPHAGRDRSIQEITDGSPDSRETAQEATQGPAAVAGSREAGGARG